MRAERKAKEKAERENNKPAQEVAKVRVKEEEISPNEYFKLRNLAVEKMEEMGENPFPPNYPVDISPQDFIPKFKNLPAGEVVESEVYSMAGKGRKV